MDWICLNCYTCRTRVWRLLDHDGKRKRCTSTNTRSVSQRLFVHCACHRLNLVVNDLNTEPKIRNATETVKSVIRYIRESVQRRGFFLKIPLLCETRWTEKYKSIRIFRENFVEIHDVMYDLFTRLHGKPREKAHQLYSAMNTCIFVICLVIISKYSSILETVTQVLQQVNMDVNKVRNHVKTAANIQEPQRKQWWSVSYIVCWCIESGSRTSCCHGNAPKMWKNDAQSHHDAQTPEEYINVDLSLFRTLTLWLVPWTFDSENTSKSYRLWNISSREKWKWRQRKILLDRWVKSTNFTTLPITWLNLKHGMMPVQQKTSTIQRVLSNCWQKQSTILQYKLWLKRFYFAGNYVHRRTQFQYSKKN